MPIDINVSITEVRNLFEILGFTENRQQLKIMLTTRAFNAATKS